MCTDIKNPLIIERDRTLLLEVHNPLFEEARDTLLRFAELQKSPEHIHTYKLTPISIWNAASSGFKTKDIISKLKYFAKYEIPENIIFEIKEWMMRYGKLKITRKGTQLILESTDKNLFSEIIRNKKVESYIYKIENEKSAFLLEWSRGQVKKECIDLGYPVIDEAGFSHGDSFNIKIKEKLVFRKYQKDALKLFCNYEKKGGSGIVVLPCGAGKTIVGMGAMENIKEKTLILVTNITALRQWKKELINKTYLKDDDIGEYSGEAKEIKPITIATYQILTYKKSKKSNFLHLERLNKENWGLVIYDEVHLLPAPVFRFACEVQTRKRLGLTATLIREDGKERDVFSLIGPKIYDIPWKILEKQGWIAKAICTEIRIELPEDEKYIYAFETKRNKCKIAYINEKKYPIVKTLLSLHKNDNLLIIGQYIKQLEHIAKTFNLNLITGKTPNFERQILYDRFRNGEIKSLVVSKVANFAIDLPDANVAIQVSGSFGSRQEEAQRLGRILRPKLNKQAHFYSIVTRDTVEINFAEKRQLFLTEQGYTYEIINEEDLETLPGL